MLESRFATLRERLESGARPPAFDEIRVRRARRTRRISIAATALATVFILGVATAAETGLRGAHRQPQVPIGGTPSATASVSGTTPTTEASPSSTEQAPQQPGIAGLAAAPSGVLFALSDRCVASCSNTPHYEYTLLRSGDLSAHWSNVGVVTGGPAGGQPRLIVADQTHLWLTAGGAVAGSIDGGHTWRWSNLGASADAGGHDVTGAASGPTAWFAWGNGVWIATNGGAPVRTAAAPAGIEIRRMLAIDATRVYALVDNDTATATWYTTVDRGEHWTAVADPCAGSRFPGSSFSSMSAARDGALWVVCASEPGAGEMPKDLVISTSGSTGWTSRGQLESNGYGIELWPFSATTAWRTGGRADIFRTTDGRHWTDLVDLEGNGPAAFVAIDAQTAVYAYGAPYPSMRIFLTRDGGATWTWHTLG
jgi:hypothetical protein